MHYSKPSPLTNFNPAPWVAHRQAGGNLKWPLISLGLLFPLPSFPAEVSGLLKARCAPQFHAFNSFREASRFNSVRSFSSSSPTPVGKKDGLILIPQQTGQFHWPQGSPFCSQQRTFLKIFLYWSLHKCLTRCINVPSQATTESSHYFMSVTIWNLIKYLALITCVNPNASFTEWFTERNPARIVQMEHFYGASFFPKHVWVYCA